MECRQNVGKKDTQKAHLSLSGGQKRVEQVPCGDVRDKRLAAAVRTIVSGVMLEYVDTTIVTFSKKQVIKCAET